MKAFPIPVVAATPLVGPGSQPDDDTLAYLPMPQGMLTFRAPLLPEPEDVAGCSLAHRVLRDALVQLERVCREGGTRSVDLTGLPAADLQLVNQVLGEGEVSAVVAARAAGELELRVQESVFAGVWRVVASAGSVVRSDRIELGAVPQALHTAAQEDVAPAMPPWQGALPPNVQNAPAVLAELQDHWHRWQPGQPAHVVNLSLLPMSVQDIGFLDHHLGTGRVLVLSRGYGNCRISNTLRPHCWRAVYYNSQDAVILNTVEVTELPEVAQAAPEDLADSRDRLAEVLAWLEGV